MKKIKTLAIVLIVAMGLMGAGYAVWTDSVVISGSVETGTMNVVIDGVTQGGYGKYIFTLKNIGNIDAKVTGVDIEGISEELSDDLTITVERLVNNTVLKADGALI